MSNPLLAITELPKFSSILPEHVSEAIDFVLAKNRSQIVQLQNLKEITWESLCLVSEAMANELERVWSPVSHLNSVMSTVEFRKTHDENLLKISEYSTELGQNAALYRAWKSLKESSSFCNFDRYQQRIVRLKLREFRLSGVALNDPNKKRFAQISIALAQLSSTFEAQVLDATDAWTKSVSLDQLRGLPDDAIALCRELAIETEQDAWVISLQFPIYYAVITYAEDRSLREEIYHAYVTRASNQGPNAGKWDNSSLIEEIVALRHEMANLLGFSNYSELSLETKMANSSSEVFDFLHSLLDEAKPRALQEIKELEAYALRKINISTLSAWDINFLSEKLKHEHSVVSDQDLKPYFQLSSVLTGLFSTVRTLYGITISPRESVDRWHPDVRFYDVADQHGTLIAGFYLDLHARSNKRGGAWMDVCTARYVDGQSVQLPVAYLTCNFMPEIEGEAVLLTHSELVTLFHEFGHGLHHMMSRIDYPSISGISGVEWDAVELPSQILENWCWQEESLMLFAKHVQTQERMPHHLLEKMRKAKHFQSGLFLVRQLEFALFDMHLHADYDPTQATRVQETMNAVRQRVSVIQPPAYNRFPCSFSHIFGGGYGAGYYSYLWAELLSADAFSRFQEEGIFNLAVGEAFKTEILEVGGSRSAMESFVAFRKREPVIGPLLASYGLQASTQSSESIR